MVRTFIRRLIDKMLSLGLLGFGIGTFIESLGVPFGGLALQLGSGGLIRSGKMTFLDVFVVSTTGLILGSIASYYIGYFGVNLSHRLRRKPKPPSRFMKYISGSLSRSGFFIITLSQLYGPTRTMISIPAGVARMNIKVFILGTAIGGALYCAGIISISLLITRLAQDAIRFFISVSHLYLLAVVFGIALVTLSLWRHFRQAF